jgi:hypothetical protein
MTISAAVLDAMLAAGASAEVIAAAVKVDIAENEARLERKRIGNAERQRRFRVAHSNASNALHGVSNALSRVTPPSLETKVPPTPPLKTQSLSPKETPSIEGGKKNPKTRSRIVPGWAPNEANLEYAGKLGLLETDIRRETEKFRDHHLKTGTAFFDWNAAWRTWCQRVHEFALKPPPNGTGPPRKLRGSAALSDIASRPLSETFGTIFDEPSVHPNGNFAARNGR